MSTFTRNVVRARLGAACGVSLAALLAVIGTAAQAQELQMAQAATPAKPAAAAAAAPVAKADPKGQLEEVVVTGSRIARTNLNQPTPILVLNSEAVKLTGLTSLGDLVNTLPQTQNNMVGSTNQRFVNGAGAQFVNLRGLGEYRTLTVVDGIRHIGSLSGRNGNGGTSLVDLASIPPSLIDRIDVVTGGSSAVYGADAVAGVVNVVLKKNYEGAELSYQHTMSDEKGINIDDVSGIIGTRFAQDRGSIMFAFDYNDDSGLYGRDRQQAMNQLVLVTNPNITGPNSPARITISNARSSSVAADGRFVIRPKLGTNSALTLSVSPDGTSLVPFNRGTQVNPGNGSTVGDASSIGGDGAITNQYIALRAPSLRHVEDVVLDYEVARGVGFVRNINFFSDVKYSQVSGEIENTPTSSGTGSAADGVNNPASGGLLVKNDNPYLPTALKTLMTSAGVTSITGTRLNVDWFGPRKSYYDSQSFRAVMGFKGELNNDWKYQTYYNYGRNNGNFGNNTILTQQWVQALDSVRLADGSIACRDVTARANGCVAINPFKVGSLTQAQKAYVFSRTFQNTTVTQENAGANIAGNLVSFANPISKTVAPIGFAAGVEYRKEATNDRTDYLLNLTNANAISTNILPQFGKASYNVLEGFGELNVPVLRDLPFVKAFDLNLAGRYSSYSSTGMAQTWNMEGSWTVTEDVRIRSGLARAVRAPNLDDLYSPQSPTFITITDPCSIDSINNGGAARLANCRAAGAPAGFRSSDYAAGYINQGGNPKLRNEIGTTSTLGAVITPRFLPDFSFSADYWLVKIARGQQFVGSDTILQGCYDKGIQAYCGLIKRRGDFSIDNLPSLAQNVGKEKVDGVDFSAKYNLELSKLGLARFGAVGFGVDMTYTPQHYVVQDPSDLSTKAYLAGGIGYSKIRGRLQTVWNWDDLTVALTNRMVGEAETFTNQISAGSRPLADFNKIPAFWYHDISAKYGWRNFTFSAGITNLTDERAPNVPLLYLASSFGGGLGTYPAIPSASGGPGAYDINGRMFFIGAKVSL